MLYASKLFKTPFTSTLDELGTAFIDGKACVPEANSFMTLLLKTFSSVISTLLSMYKNVPAFSSILYSTK